MRQRAAGAALADHGGDDRDGQARHLQDRLGDRHRLAALLGLQARVGARRVDERDDRQPEAHRVVHQPQRLAVALRVGHPEVALHHLGGRAALLVADGHHRQLAEPREPADDRRVLGEQAVAVELLEVVEDQLDVVERVRARRACARAGRRPTGRAAGSESASITGATPSVSGSRSAGSPERARLGAGVQREQPADDAADVLARLDQVDHPVLEQELRGLEARRAASGRSSARSPTGRRSRCGRPARRSARRPASRRRR